MSLGRGARRCGFAVVVVLVGLPVAAADESDKSGLADHSDSPGTSWSARAELNIYLQADQGAYFQPTVAVDHGGLHLEGRYNYEAQSTGSVWVGWNFEWGKSLKLALTPMLGGVIGALNGIAPGLEWDLSWGPFEFYSENEFVFDLTSWSDSDYYTWSELTGAPLDWVRVGLSVQRTRVIASSRAVQWGPMVGFKVWKLSATAYWFNPGQAGVQYGVLSFGANF